MKRLVASIFALAIAALPAGAQSLDDLNIQIHGYATQGFLVHNQQQHPHHQLKQRQSGVD
jgi:hypothetical protein